MKKLFFILVSAVLISVGCFAICTVSIPTEHDDYALEWLEEESYLVDYEITDQQTIKFRYAICFVNNTEVDKTISLSARFKSEEMKECLKDDYYSGNDESGELLYVKIKGHEKRTVVFVFEGPYLGGIMKESLSFPDIICTTSFG